MLKILSSDAHVTLHYSTLEKEYSFDNIIAPQTTLHSNVTRSVMHSEPLAITANKQALFNSFYIQDLEKI